jgi:hypothetical protein
MPRLDKGDRKLAVQLEIERQLRPLMGTEAVEVLARIMAHIINRDPQFFPQLTEQFRTAFAAEHEYLAQCRTRSRTSAATDPGSGGIT